MITPADRRLYFHWQRRARALSDRELEIAACALSERHAWLSLRRAFAPRADDPPAGPSFGFELQQERERAR